jgi:hypothetical protein
MNISTSDITVDGKNYEWWVERQPQWCHEDSWKGVLLGVQITKQKSRSCLIQLPFEVKSSRSVPGRQRPKISQKQIESYIREALEAGWEPESKGKPFQYEVTKHT